MAKTKPTVLEELTAEQLASVNAGARKWCCRNGKWYVCGSGKRSN